MKNTKIYLVENCFGDPNKVYIGKTKKSRKNAHKQTYGKQIEYTYIDEVNSLNKQDWEPLESYWIEQFRQWGFEVMNVRKKGGGGPEFVTDETKIKISKALKGRVSFHHPTTGEKISESKQGMRLTDEWKNKISESTKGNKNRLGTIQSQETKDKISEALKGKKRPQDVIEKMKKPKTDNSNFGKHRKGVVTSEETKIKQRKSAQYKQKPVLQFDKQNNLIKEYPGVIEASKQTGCYDSAIVMCCKGKLKTTKGFIFKYKN
jgi:hypothetical protein